LVFLFSTAASFGCQHQPSSNRHRFTKAAKREEASPEQDGVKLLFKIVINDTPKKQNDNIKDCIKIFLGIQEDFSRNLL
jgi:hypothetical protein